MPDVSKVRLAALLALGLIMTLALVALPGPSSPAVASGDGSGAPATAHYPGGAEIKSGAVVADAPDPELYRIVVEKGAPPIPASEPTLGVTKSDDIFYAAFQTNTRVEIAHSGDGGHSWDLRSPKIGNRNAQLLSLDPYVWVDPYTDRIFTIDLTVACAYLSFSDDQGKSWLTNPLACGRPVNDHQTLTSGPAAVSPTPVYENVVYYCWNDVGSSSCSKSLDGGITFHLTGQPAFRGVDPEAGGQGDAFCGGLHGHAHVGNDGTLYLPKGHCDQPWLAISKDEGATWTRVKVASNGIEGHEAGVATDKKGNIYYTYVGRDRLPYLVISENGGKDWTRPMMIGPPGIKEANLPGIAVGGEGKVAVVYMGSTNSPFKPAKEDGGECTAVNTCGDGDNYNKTTWNGYMTISANALDSTPVFYSGTVNDPRDPLIRNTCGPGRCRAVYDFIDIVIAPKSGEVWAAFVDGCTSICATAAGSSNIGSDAVVGHLRGGPKLK